MDRTWQFTFAKMFEIYAYSNVIQDKNTPKVAKKLNSDKETIINNLIKKNTLELVDLNFMCICLSLRQS